MRPRDLAGPFGVPGAFDTAGGAIPRGIICMWSGRLDEMPPGWALCDGANGTPNIVARFVRGINTATTNPGTTGGSDSHVHGHSTTHVHDTGFHFRSGYISRTASLGTGSAQNSAADWGTSNESVSRARERTAATAPGNTDSADGRPAYYELAFIMKL